MQHLSSLNRRRALRARRWCLTGCNRDACDNGAPCQRETRSSRRSRSSSTLSCGATSSSSTWSDRSRSSDGGVVDVTVSLTTPGCPIKNHFQTAVANAVGALDGVKGVNVGFDVLSDQQKAGLQRKLGRPGGCPRARSPRSPSVLCIGSGKGGVGKSSLTVNLAAALAAEGKKVGVLDADVWGYSIPRMLGLGAERPKISAERKILPLEAHGLKVMSIGFFLDEDEAVVWRGPMLHKALTQFLEDVAWGELDHLLIDLPPAPATSR